MGVFQQQNQDSTKYLRNTRNDADFEVNSGIQGMILETTDGGKYGMRHMSEMWLQVYEVAFAKDAGLAGKIVNKITYIMADGAYVYEFANGIYIKPQATETMVVSPEFADSIHIKLANLDKYNNPKVSVFYTTGVEHASKTTYLAQDVAAANGVVTLDSTVARPENETYTVKVSSDDYADVSVQLVYGTIAFKEKSGTLYIGSSRQLEATGENCKDVTYSSNNEKVASVDAKGKVTYGNSSKSVATVSTSGKITAKKAGTATITVKCGSYKATCKITVKKGSLKITSKTAVTVKTKKTTTIKATATSKAKITYRSSNTKIATVSSKGVVKGVKKRKSCYLCK